MAGRGCVRARTLISRLVFICRPHRFRLLSIESRLHPSNDSLSLVISDLYLGAAVCHNQPLWASAYSPQSLGPRPDYTCLPFSSL